MKRARTIMIASAALAAALPVLTAHGEVLSVTQVAQPDVYGPRYDFGPRIIHVPQPGEDDDDVASVSNVRRAMPDDDDDIERLSPVPRRQSAPKPQKQKTSAAPPAPRRKPYSAAAEVHPAPVDRRTVQSAPVYDGPSPVRPTPHFAKETGVKFSAPMPPGYAPPANLPGAATPVAPAAQEPALDVAPSGE
jgi:hypothetical protein